MAVYRCPVRKGNRTITINSLNIVSGLQTNMEDEQYNLPFDKFYKKMVKGIMKDNDAFSIIYDPEKEFFETYYHGLPFKLLISPERLRAYQVGQYDQITEQLHNLVTLTERSYKEDKIITDINNGTLTPNADNKQIYLSNLRRENRKMNKVIIGTGAFFSLTPISVCAVVFAPSLITNPATLEAVTVCGSLVAMGAMTLDMLIFSASGVRRAMADGIRNKISNRRAYKQLKQQPLLPGPANTDSLKNQQLVSINNLVYMCQPLEDGLKKTYLEKIRALLEEYTTEFKRISAIKKSGITLEVMDEETAFNASMTKKTIELELELLGVLKKNEKVIAVIQDSNTIERNIETLEAGQNLVSMSR